MSTEITSFSYLYVQDSFKDVLKLIMQSFETIQTNEISFKNDNVRCRLLRSRDDRMTFDAYAISEDTDYEIIHCTFFYNTDTALANLRSTHFRLISNYDNIGYSTYKKDSTTLLMSHSTDAFTQAKQCLLQYPFQEEQVFQELTRFPVPLESDMNLFMNTGAYVMEGITTCNAYSFSSGWIAEDQINETNREIMVQSVREALDGLIEVEKERLERSNA